MEPIKRRVKIFRMVWGAIPWMVVLCLIAAVFLMMGRIKEEKGRLEAEKKDALKKDVPAAKVIILTLEPEDIEDKINLPAEMDPLEEVLVKAEVPGQVVKIHAREGQKVTQGQVLVELDDRDYRSRLVRVEANFELATLEYERNLALTKSRATSKSALDSIEARVKDLEAQRIEAKLALDKTLIKAPISCTLNDIMVEKGDFLGTGDPVAQILQIDRIKVTVGVPESDVAAIFDLEEADVIIEALGDLKITGKKIFLAKKPRTLARLYDLELLISNPDGRILPGMFARVELVKRRLEDALRVPLYAVITQEDRQFVFIDDHGKARKRPVDLGILSDWQVQVTSGLAPGDRVIVVGHRQVDDGQPLEIIKTVNDPAEIL